MGDRFVVVPVGQDSDRDPDSSGGAAGDSLNQQDAVPILEYSREPNKYGKFPRMTTPQPNTTSSVII